MNKNVFVLFISILTLGILLRLSYLTHVPPALHGDELGAGYNAYSLFLTGRDEYGKFLPITFRNDFSPMVFYSAIPFVAYLGLSEASTRLPTVFISILTLSVVYFFTFTLFKQKKLAVLAIFLVTISSWHIRSGRPALEMSWALFFQLLGTIFFLRTKPRQTIFLCFGFILFSLAIYSYPSAKMTTPLLVLGLSTIYWQKIRRSLLLIITLFTLCIVFPLLIHFAITPISQMRFSGISVFAQWRNFYPQGTNLVTIGPLIDLTLRVCSNYVKHFDPGILFLDNSSLRYYQTNHVGLFYLWQFPFILLGLIWGLFHWKMKEYQLLLFWFFISPIPAAFTSGVPYANIGRNLMILPAIELLCAIGLSILGKLIIQRSFHKKILYVSVTLFSIIFLLNFMKEYFINVPKEYSRFWGVPWRNTVETILPYETSVNKIIMANPTNQSYMYLLFYGRKNPSWLLSSAKVRAKVVGYTLLDRYEFRTISWNRDRTLRNTLIIGASQDIPLYDLTISRRINIPIEDNQLRAVIVN